MKVLGFAGVKGHTAFLGLVPGGGRVREDLSHTFIQKGGEGGYHTPPPPPKEDPPK